MSVRITTFEQYLEDYRRSIENPKDFWAEIAENFTWRKKWDKVLEWNFTEPNVKWFIGAKLNITENCIDSHLKEKRSKLPLFGSLTVPMKRVTALPIINYMNKFAAFQTF